MTAMSGHSCCGIFTPFQNVNLTGYDRLCLQDGDSQRAYEKATLPADKDDAPQCAQGPAW